MLPKRGILLSEQLFQCPAIKWIDVAEMMLFESGRLLAAAVADISSFVFVHAGREIVREEVIKEVVKIESLETEGGAKLLATSQRRCSSVFLSPLLQTDCSMLWAAKGTSALQYFCLLIWVYLGGHFVLWKYQEWSQLRAGG